jgi:DNA-binding CsgD family transcriptional regulator
MKNINITMWDFIKEANLEYIFDSLTDREKDIIFLRYGFKDGERKTYAEIGKPLNLSPERIRQYVFQAFRKIRMVNYRNSMKMKSPVVAKVEINPLEEQVYYLLSVRPANCLRFAQIKTVGELIQLTEDDLLKMRKLGEKSLKEIKSMLAKRGLSLKST